MWTSFRRACLIDRSGWRKLIARDREGTHVHVDGVEVDYRELVERPAALGAVIRR
jgi:hypothetical protein